MDPDVDKLAADGIRFTQFYNCGRCCPTRASLLTGVYPHRAGIGFMTAQDFGKPGYRADLSQDTPTIAEALKPAGYKSHLAGEWHVCREFAAYGPNYNWPLQRGFDRFYGTLIAAGSQWDPLTLTDGNHSAKLPTGTHYTDVIADKATRFINEHFRQSSTTSNQEPVTRTAPPFFLYVAHTAPHWPLHARDDVLEKYRGRFGDSLEHPDGMIGSTGKPKAYIRYVPLFTPTGEPVTAGDIPGWQLGPPNTCGGYGTPWANVSNAPFRRFKKDTSGGGIATPFIIHWPKRYDRGCILRHQPAHVIDLMPTILDAAGVSPPGKPAKSLDGRSLLPALTGSTVAQVSLFWEHHGNRGVRYENRKLVSLFGTEWELYDLANDRTETTNLARKHQDVVKRLSKLYDDWAARSGVIPREQLDIPEIPPGNNPLVRSPQEMKACLETVNLVLEKRGFETFGK